MTSFRCLALGVAAWLGASIACPPGGLAVDDVPYWPSEQEARLEELSARALDLQHQLFQARMSGNQAEAERLAPEYRSVKNERLKLLKAAGRL